MRLSCATQATRHGRRNEVKAGTTFNSPAQTQVVKSTYTSLTSCQLDEGVRLQTFLLWITGPSGALYIRDILGGCSHRNFIEEELVVKLGLKVVGETSLVVNAFASAVPSEVQECETVGPRLRKPVRRCIASDLGTHHTHDLS